MGMNLSKIGSKSRLIKLRKWKEGKESTWNFVVDGVELCQQLLQQKRKVEVQLNEEVLKRKKCEEVVCKLQCQPSSHTRKPLSEVSRQQQYNRKKEMVRNVKKSLSNCCKNEGFQLDLLELQDKNTGNHVILDVCNATFTCKDEQANTTDAIA